MPRTITRAGDCSCSWADGAGCSTISDGTTWSGTERSSRGSVCADRGVSSAEGGGGEQEKIERGKQAGAVGCQLPTPGPGGPDGDHWEPRPLRRSPATRTEREE